MCRQEGKSLILITFFTKNHNFVIYRKNSSSNWVHNLNESSILIYTCDLIYIKIHKINWPLHLKFYFPFMFPSLYIKSGPYISKYVSWWSNLLDIPFPHIRRFLTPWHDQQTTYEGEIAQKEKFLHLPQCFLLFFINYA